MAAAIGFALAFALNFFLALFPPRLRHIPIPDLPGFTNAASSESTLPIEEFLLHEGEWTWARGGDFFVLPRVINDLPPKILRAAERAIEEANRAGAAPPWRIGEDGANRAAGYQLAAAAALASDWWGLQSRRPREAYENRVAGRAELGLSPWALAALYEANSIKSQAEDAYPLSGPANLDPVTQREFPCSLRGIARLYAEAAHARSTSDTAILANPPGWPFSGESIRLMDLRMDEPPREILPPKPVEGESEREAATEALAQALRRHGILLAGMREDAWPAQGREEWLVRNACVIFGDYRTETDRSFLISSPLGFPKGDGKGRARFALVKAEGLIGALAFPHPLRFASRLEHNSEIRLELRDYEGNLARVRTPEELRLEFDARLRADRYGVWRIKPAPSAKEPLWASLAPRFTMPVDGPVRIPLPMPDDAVAD